GGGATGGSVLAQGRAGVRGDGRPAERGPGRHQEGGRAGAAAPGQRELPGPGRGQGQRRDRGRAAQGGQRPGAAQVREEEALRRIPHGGKGTEGTTETRGTERRQAISGFSFGRCRPCGPWASVV